MLENTMQRFMIWSVKTFTKATAQVGLLKLMEETKEINDKLIIFETQGVPGHFMNTFKDDLAEEYADAILCLLHSAAKMGFNADDIAQAIENKVHVNEHCEWILNKDNTYSHVS